MCGISGLFAFNPVGRMNLMHLEASTRALEKRGPDVHDTWFDDVVGLGHRRLSILDTSDAGNQPMRDSSGRYHIVFNGEIYNYKALRLELSQKGVSFSSDSDTEVLLQAYIVWGADMLPKLNGFFSFAIYDQVTRKMFIARDRYGIKPLLFCKTDNSLLFASEMKSLLCYGLEKKINQEALSLYFQLTYIPPPLSIIEGVEKLKPGHYLEIEKGNVDQKCYYKLPDPNTNKPWKLKEAQVALVDRLTDSVRARLVSDVPLGAFLSGGIDSSIIVGLASKDVPKLKTFSIGFKDNKYFDETAYANLVADHFATDHHVFSLSNDDLLSAVGDVVEYIDEPFADSSALPVHILSKKTKKHVTVALSGDGADELFSGYNKHSAWLHAQHPNITSKIASIGGPIWSLLPKSRNNRLTDTFRKLDRFAKLSQLSASERYWYLAAFIEKSQVDRLLLNAPDRSAFRDELLRSIKTGDLNEVLALDCKMVLSGDMLQKVDLMSMANSLEVRVPFLDPNVVQFAFELESKLKAQGKSRKIILREAFRDMLPKELYHRPKHGFEVPLLDWFRKEMKGELDQIVFDQEKIVSQGIFEWNEIARIKKKLYSFDPGDSHILVWSLYVFQKWHQKYFIS
ncbi:MAG: asparagine synthase (glutamine-hydrolyzing) [Marinoscillum sp.]|jgi:asparagine synthase (glutamine-hydrolysing)